MVPWGKNSSKDILVHLNGKFLNDFSNTFFKCIHYILHKNDIFRSYAILLKLSIKLV